MRFAIILAIGLATAACQTAPISYTAPVPEPQDDAYSCALREFNRLGFQIVNADREAGFITGEKQTSGLATAVLTGSNYYDHLTISVFEDGSGGETMRVTAGSMNESALGFRGKKPNVPQETAKTAARQILQTCASGEIMEQSGSGSFDALL